MLHSWVQVLRSVGACSSSLLHSLHALSCLRMQPRISSTIESAQAASGRLLVDCLAKPLSFCAPLIRGISSLHSILRQGRPPCITNLLDFARDKNALAAACNATAVWEAPAPAAPPGVLASAPPSSASLHPSGPRRQPEGAAADAADKHGECHSARSGAEIAWRREWPRLQLQGVLLHTKEVAASVERCRRHAQQAGLASLPAQAIQEHRILVGRTEVWRVLATDQSVGFFLTQKAGSASGILDEVPAVVTLFNDALHVEDKDKDKKVTSMTSPEKLVDLEDAPAGSLMFLLDAVASPVTCALGGNGTGCLPPDPGDPQLRAPEAASESQAWSRGEGVRRLPPTSERTTGHCVALAGGSGRMLLVRLDDEKQRDVWLSEVRACISSTSRRYRCPYGKLLFMLTAAQLYHAHQPCTHTGLVATRTLLTILHHT